MCCKIQYVFLKTKRYWAKFSRAWRLVCKCQNKLKGMSTNEKWQPNVFAWKTGTHFRKQFSIYICNLHLQHFQHFFPFLKNFIYCFNLALFCFVCIEKALGWVSFKWVADKNWNLLLLYAAYLRWICCRPTPPPNNSTV